MRSWGPRDIPSTSRARSPRVFLLAGETSGDVHAAHLAEALRAQLPSVDLVGAGGPRMGQAGVRVLLDTSTWGVVGYLEAYVRVPLFVVRFRRVLELVRRTNPDVLVLVDFPGFNVFVARAVSRKVPTLYYFPPMVHGRRTRRARALAELPVRVMATFPFEYEAYKATGADVCFVGHPALDLARPSRPRRVLWEELGLKSELPLVALLPGSRPQEVRALLPVQLAACRLLQQRGLPLQAAVAVASEGLQPLVRAVLRRAGVELPAPTGFTYDLLAHADAAVVASGTATLEAAVLNTPMVVVYRVSRPTEWVARRVATLPWVSLPNLLAGRQLVPELLQDRCRAELVAAEVGRLLERHGEARQIRGELRQLVAALGPPGAVKRAAQEVLVRLGVASGRGVP